MRILRRVTLGTIVGTAVGIASSPLVAAFVSIAFASEAGDSTQFLLGSAIYTLGMAISFSWVLAPLVAGTAASWIAATARWPVVARVPVEAATALLVAVCVAVAARRSLTTQAATSAGLVVAVAVLAALRTTRSKFAISKPDG